MPILDDLAQSTLGNLLEEHGANILAGIVRNAIPGGAVLVDIAETLAKSFGASSTNAEDIADAVANGPAAPGPILQEITDARADSWARAIEAEASAAEAYNQVLLADANGQGWLQRNWRPLNGLLFGIACFLSVFAVAIAVFAVAVGMSGDFGQIGNLIAVVGPIIVAWAGVVGAYVRYRSKEKISAAGGTF